MNETSTSTLTVGELVSLFLTHAKSHYRNRAGEPTREDANFASVLKRFTAHVGPDAPASRINRHQVRAWLDQLAAEQLSRVYVNQCLTKLRTAIRWAADLDHIDARITADLRLVKPLQPFRTRAKEATKRTPPPLTEIDQLAHFLAPHWCAVLQLCQLTGCRPSEIITITNADIHLDSFPRLTPRQHKSAHKGKSRVIPLSPRAVSFVERFHRPFCPADALFAARRGRGHSLSIEGYRKAFLLAAAKAGLPGLWPYDVRRAVGRRVRRKFAA